MLLGAYGIEEHQPTIMQVEGYARARVAAQLFPQLPGLTRTGDAVYHEYGLLVEQRQQA